MALITRGSQVAEASLFNQSDSVSGLVPYVGDTVIVNFQGSYTPGISATSNCTATIVTTNNSSNPSQSRLTISLASSSTGTFSVGVYQSYGGRSLSVTGTVQSGTYGGPPRSPMSMGGDETGQSINLELGNSATSSINLGDSGLRSLANVPSGAIDIGDFYGTDASNANPPFGLAISYNAGSNTYTDTAIPANTSGSNNTQITGTALWRRVRLTTSSNGTFYLHIRGQRDGSATHYYGDAQVVAYVTKAGGAGETINRLHTSSGIMSGWQTYMAGTGSTWDSSSASSAGTSGSAGRFVFKTTNTVTGSSQTGRLSTASFSGAIGYGYFETSSQGAPASNAYYHARSPSFTLNGGDHVDVYYGVDCQAWQSIKFSLIT